MVPVLVVSLVLLLSAVPGWADLPSALVYQAVD